MDWNILLRYCLAALLVLLAPGAALLAWLPARREPGRVDILPFLADSAALSIAIPALIELWLFVAGIRVGPLFAIGFYAAALLFLIAALVWKHFHWPGRAQTGAAILGMLFFAALFGWRLYQARELLLPAWVDSVHHSLVVRAIIEYGGIPPDLSPYIPAPFYFHYGFHLITALFSFLAGVTAEQAVLWFGQVLNALVGLSVYRLADSLRVRAAPPQPDGQPGGESAGLPSLRRVEQLAWSFFPALAALLVTFVFQMPAYYLTWGRYTLLAGLILVGPALAAALEIWEAPLQRGAWLRLALLITGLCLTHYFALLLVALFLLVLGLFGLFQGFSDRERWKIVFLLAALSLLGVLLAAPWIWRVWQGNQALTGVDFVTPFDQSESAQKGAVDYLRYLAYLMGPRRNHILFGMAAVGLLFALRRRQLHPFVVWALLLSVFELPWGIRFNPFRPDYFAIVLFFPAALLLADLLAAGAAAVGRLACPWLGVAVLAGTAALFLVWGVRETRDILNPVTVFVSAGDVSALQWIRKNTPPTARFYINSTVWIGSLYRGVDGGYWLTPYTGRFSLIPPALYPWGRPEYVAQITDWAVRSSKLQGCTPDFWSLVRDAGLTHIYLRDGQGHLQPAMLAGCPRLGLIYQQAGISIYQILPAR